jgi:hypothetical protein
MIEGGQHGSLAPVAACGAITLRPAFSPDGLVACLSGACWARIWGPYLGENLLGWVCVMQRILCVHLFCQTGYAVVT